jgi:hypothetical protein
VGGFNRAAELQMPLVNLTDIEIHFNFAGIGWTDASDRGATDA